MVKEQIKPSEIISLQNEIVKIFCFIVIHFLLASCSEKQRRGYVQDELRRLVVLIRPIHESLAN